MKIRFVLLIVAFVLCTNLIHSTIAMPEQSTVATTTTATSNNVDENKSKLHRVRLISSLDDDNNDEKQKTWSSLFDESMVTSDENNNKQINATSCSEQCKDFFGTTNDDSEKFQSCINGCRYYTINLILTQKNISAGYTSSLSSVKSECFNSCVKVYPNDTKSISICNFGCRLADNAQSEKSKTRPIITISSVATHDESTDNNTVIDATESVKSASNDGKDEKKRTFSMFIPIRTITSANELDDNSQPESLDRVFAQNNMPSSLSQMMMSMVRSMAERARQMIDFARTQQQKMEDDRFSMDFDSSSNTGEAGGEAVSYERSMSVMMTKDKDGNNKLVVMREPPKITIHRAWNPLGLDFDRFKTEKATDLNQRLKQLEHEGEERLNGNKLRVLMPWKWSGGWDSNRVQQEQNADEDRLGNLIFHRINSFGLPQNQQNNDDVNHDADDDDVMVINTVDPNKSNSLPWSTCLISMMPLLYLLMVILLLYIIIWLFYSVPNYVICKNRRGRSHPSSSTNGRNSSETILPLSLDDDSYRERRRRLFQKLFHLSRAQRYCKLSAFTGFGEKTSPITPATKSPSSATGNDLSPTGSTLSFPPPYAEAAAFDKTFSVPETTLKVNELLTTLNSFPVIQKKNESNK
ncbi:uncharacterized protein LOC124495906 [Dermatophagoides farinae]